MITQNNGIAMRIPLLIPMLVAIKVRRTVQMEWRMWIPGTFGTRLEINQIVSRVTYSVVYMQSVGPGSRPN